ncbi:hypothetical protein MMPV_001646 [Pyropia vietnamensis]
MAASTATAATAAAAAAASVSVPASKAVMACYVTEGAVTFRPASRFFRPASSTVRDLGVLAVAALACRLGRPPRVLDAYAGAGVRAARYVVEGGAGYAWANDACSSNLAGLVGGGRGAVTHTTARACLDAIAAAAAGVPPVVGPTSNTEAAAKAVAAAAAQYEPYDFIDLDQFGVPSIDALADAVRAVGADGGALYLCATDAMAGAGKRRAVALRSWAAAPVPVGGGAAANEQFLRCVIGAAYVAGAAAGRAVSPSVAYFDRASATARVVVSVGAASARRRARARRDGDGDGDVGREGGEADGGGKVDDAAVASLYGFVVLCRWCGQVATATFEALPGCRCGACAAAASRETLVISGPMIGPLHNRAHLAQMTAAAARVTPPLPPRTLTALATLAAEAHPALDGHPLSIGLGDLSRRAGVAATPPRAVLVAGLSRQGYVAVPAATGDKAIKTNAPVAVAVAVVREEAARAAVAAAAVTATGATATTTTTATATATATTAAAAADVAAGTGAAGTRTEGTRAEATGEAETRATAAACKAE